MTLRRKMVGTGVSRLTDMRPWPNYGPPPVSGYALWMDASREETITHSRGVVSQINDLSGNANHPVQATAARKPLVVRRAINDRTCLGFLAGQQLDVTGVSRSTHTQTSFVVGVAFDFGVYGHLIGSSGNGGNSWRIDQTDGHMTSFRPNVGTILNSNAGTVAAQPFVAVQILDASNLYHRLDSFTDSVSHSTSFTAGNTAVIGARAGATEALRGAIGEVIIYNTALSSGDVDLVQAYLKAKWGTP